MLWEKMGIWISRHIWGKKVEKIYRSKIEEIIGTDSSIAESWSLSDTPNTINSTMSFILFTN
jgi:hypothetical protein